jgi:hypothetical protein
MQAKTNTRAAEVCGANIDGLPEGSGRAHAFEAHLVVVIAKHELDAFFLRDPALSINGIDVRPRGYDYRIGQVDASAMAEWRRAYKALPPARQMMAATIITLYRGEPDKTWLARLPSTWHAADAIAALTGSLGAARLGPPGCIVSGC